MIDRRQRLRGRNSHWRGCWIALSADERKAIDAALAAHDVAGSRYPETSMGTLNG